MSTRVRHLPFTDPRLGRHQEHDDASRGFAMPRATIDRSLWVDRRIRVYDPIPNPNQPVGNCTMCSKAMQLNSAGNRRTGVILGMDWALSGYRWETANDEFGGAWEPDDTGSSGLASAKTAQHTGDGGEYRWEFGGADGVIQNIQEGRTMSAGTVWYGGMFTGYKTYYGLPVIRPGGSIVGGHQYLVRGYARASDRAMIRCWWGEGFRDAWIARYDLDALLQDGGDAHWQARA